MEALVASFERIGRESMRGLPFYNEALSVEAVGFERFGDAWLGVLITPWFMNLMLVSDQPIPYSEAANGRKRIRRVARRAGEVPVRRDRGVRHVRRTFDRLADGRVQVAGSGPGGGKAGADADADAAAANLGGPSAGGASGRFAKNPLQFCRAAVKLGIVELISRLQRRTAEIVSMCSMSQRRDDGAGRMVRSSAIQARHSPGRTFVRPRMWRSKP